MSAPGSVNIRNVIRRRNGKTGQRKSVRTARWTDYNNKGSGKVKDDMYKVFDLIKLLLILLAIFALLFVMDGYVIGESTETEFLKSMDYFWSSSDPDTDFVLDYTSSGYYTAYRIRKDDTLELAEYPAEKTVISDSLPERDRPYAKVISRGFFNRIIKITLYVPKGTVIQGRK